MSSMNVQETFQKMALGEKIILVAGPLLFIDSFLHWYSAHKCVDTAVGQICAGGSASAWDAPGAIWSILAVLLGLIAAGLIAAVRFGNVKMPEMPQGVTWGRLLLGSGVVAAVFLLIKLLNHSGDLSYGFFIGIILVGALVAGGFLTYQEEQIGGGSSSM